MTSAIPKTPRTRKKGGAQQSRPQISTVQQKIGVLSKHPPEIIPSILRLEFILGLFLLAYAMLAIRSLDLTILQRDKLYERATAQHNKKVEIPAYRGRFLDRNGRTLAISLPVKSLSVDRDHVSDFKKLAANLAPLVDLPKEQIEGKLLAAKPGSFPIIKRKLSPEIAAKVQQLDEQALFFLPEVQRFYTMGEITSHVLGFVNFEGEGVEGLERTYERDLKGHPGIRIITRDRLGRPMPWGRTVEEAQPGTDLVLTLDATIQYIAYRALLKSVLKTNSKAGMVVVLNPTNGHILALVNQPGFNPNNMVGSLPSARRNRAIMDAFEPGSTFKIFTIAAAMDEGVVTPKTVIDIENGIFKIQNRTIRDFHRGDRYNTVLQVLQKSSNVGAAKIGLMLGQEKQEKYINNFGFGQPTGVELGHEGIGSIPNIRSYWRVGLATRSYGYGVTATPMQLAAATAGAVNGGLLYPPRIMAGKVINSRLIPNESPSPKRVISAATSEQMRAILNTVVSAEGTAAGAQVDGYEVGGKTGTARKASSTGGYSQGLYFSSFVGFVPYDKPKLLIYIGLDEPQGMYYGGLLAGPVFREIAQDVLPLMAIMPKKTQPDLLPPLVEETENLKTDENGQVSLIHSTLATSLDYLLNKKGIVPSIEGSGRVVSEEWNGENAVKLFLQ
ncbi:MAG: penicillin-binding protein 2 [Magnetococcus sp. DMHC-6]